MKTELEPHDAETLAEKVVEKLRPYLMANAKQEDEVFDKQGLADYLHVDVSWIDKQITNRAIPFFKAGKYTRFEKGRIDLWIEAQRVDPIPELKNYRRGWIFDISIKTIVHNRRTVTPFSTRCRFIGMLGGPHT